MLRRRLGQGPRHRSEVRALTLLSEKARSQRPIGRQGAARFTLGGRQRTDVFGSRRLIIV